MTIVFTTGFSNGGFFCYLLWVERPRAFAAVAPGAASLVSSIHLQTPKPAFIYGGRNDPLVRFTSQQAAINAAREVDGCENDGVVCGDQCNLFKSARQTSVMTFVHSGGHVFIPAVRSLIIESFKSHPRIAGA